MVVQADVGRCLLANTAKLNSGVLGVLCSVCLTSVSVFYLIFNLFCKPFVHYCILNEYKIIRVYMAN